MQVLEWNIGEKTELGRNLTFPEKSKEETNQEARQKHSRLTNAGKQNKKGRFSPNHTLEEPRGLAGVTGPRGAGGKAQESWMPFRALSPRTMSHTEDSAPPGKDTKEPRKGAQRWHIAHGKGIRSQEADILPEQKLWYQDRLPRIPFLIPKRQSKISAPTDWIKRLFLVEACFLFFLFLGGGAF